MKDPLFKKLFRPYLKSALSPEEEAVISEWEKKNSDKMASLPSEEELPWDEIEARMQQNIYSKIRSKSRFARITGNTFYKIAAMLVAAIAISLLIFLNQRNSVFLFVKAPKGSKRFLLLPDSSKVWLNAGSILKYPANFSTRREVYLLNGEAYFDVKHLEHSSFVVHHRDVYVKVLGTAFNVKAYGPDDTRVTVTRGRVEVGEKHTAYTVLTPDREIILKKGIQQKSLVREINAEKVSAWKSNQVHLYDVSFDDIVLSLQDNFNVKISYPRQAMKNSISTLHYSSDSDLKEVLEMIKMIYGMDYTIIGKEVYLTRN